MIIFWRQNSAKIESCRLSLPVVLWYMLLALGTELTVLFQSCPSWAKQEPSVRENSLKCQLLFALVLYNPGPAQLSDEHLPYGLTTWRRNHSRADAIVVHGVVMRFIGQRARWYHHLKCNCSPNYQVHCIAPSGSPQSVDQDNEKGMFDFHFGEQCLVTHVCTQRPYK